MDVAGDEDDELVLVREVSGVSLGVPLVPDHAAEIALRPEDLPAEQHERRVCSCSSMWIAATPSGRMSSRIATSRGAMNRSHRARGERASSPVEGERIVVSGLVDPCCRGGRGRRGSIRRPPHHARAGASRGDCRRRSAGSMVGRAALGPRRTPSSERLSPSSGGRGWRSSVMPGQRRRGVLSSAAQAVGETGGGEALVVQGASGLHGSQALEERGPVGGGAGLGESRGTRDPGSAEGSASRYHARGAAASGSRVNAVAVAAARKDTGDGAGGRRTRVRPRAAAGRQREGAPAFGSTRCARAE